MRDYQIRKILIDSKVKHNSLVKEIIKKNNNSKVYLIDLRDKSIISRFSFREGKETLLLTEFPGDFIKPCPGTGGGYLCCGYLVINQPINCPMDCTYCILQDYLGPSPLILYVNFEKLIQEIDMLNKKADAEGRIFRIGNGELSDSLALDYIGDFSSFFIRNFREKKNLIFEFKTKTDEVEKILRLSPAENIVISWSLNPQNIMEKEELFTATLERRIKAAKLVQERGFKVGFHFDPLIFYPEWQTGYRKLIENLFSSIDTSGIFWISLGALRFPSSLKELIKKRFPHSDIIYQEMIRGMDGKLRYIKPLRIKIFREIYRLIKEAAPQVFCYFCMESPDVWEKVMGFSPSSNLHFQSIFENYCKEKMKKF